MLSEREFGRGALRDLNMFKSHSLHPQCRRRQEEMEAQVCKGLEGTSPIESVTLTSEGQDPHWGSKVQ